MAQTKEVSGWVGWVYFAGALMFIRGFFEIFLGILALVKNDVYLVGPSNVVVFNFTAWGWINIVLGVILLTAAGSVISGRWWGRIIGSVMASFSLLASLAFLPAYPIWSIIAIIIDSCILYALLVRGGEAAAE